MIQAKESGWSIKLPNKSEVIVEGVIGDIPKIVDDIFDPTSKLGMIVRGKTSLLNTRGFSIKEFIKEFESRNKGSIHQFFSVITSFHIDEKRYVVKYSNNPAFNPGEVLYKYE